MSADSKFKVTTKIRTALMEDAEIVALVGSRIFPIVAPNKTAGDFITYQRDEYSKDRTKMGVAAETCKVYINAISDSYDRSQDLAYLIDKALDGTHPNLGISIYTEDSTEDFEDGKYIQSLLFEIK